MVTLKDIAKVTGVSVKTISRVVNDDKNVNPETRKKVKKVLQEMKYIPNHVAKSLVTSKTHTIGVLLANISNPFFPKVILGIEDAARKLGYSVIICNARTYDAAINGINTFIQKKVDGIIVTPMAFDTEDSDRKLFLKQLSAFDNYIEETAQRLMEVNVYISLMNYRLNVCSGKAMRVYSDETIGGYEAVEYLVSLGHRRIGHITEQLSEGLWGERIRGYRDTLQKYNIALPEDQYVQKEKESVEGGYMAMKRLLRLPEPPTAVYAANDLFAIGAINAIQEEGLKVPQDISVVGFDGIDFGDMILPRLTTVAHKRYELGYQCMLRLEEIITNRDIQPYDVILRPELVIKNSSGPVKKP